MTSNDLFTIIAQVSGLLGIVASMFAMGLGLTVAQIVQPVEECAPCGAGFAGELCTGAFARLRYHAGHPARRFAEDRIDCLGTCAGAPFLILEARGAKASLAVAVGLMTLLMVVTIFYLPVVLPLLLTGVEVDAGRSPNR